MSPPPYTRRSALQLGGTAIAGSLAGCSVLADNSSPVTIDWDAQIPRTTGSLAIHDETVYACTEDGLYTLDATSGNEGWTFSTGQNEAITRPVVVAETIFFGTLQSRAAHATMYAVTTAGEEEWSTLLSGGATTPAVADETVYVASGVMAGDSALYAFESGTGDELWTIPLDRHPAGGSPTVAGDSLYLASGGFAAFATSTGDLRWRLLRDRVEVGEAARHWPIVSSDTVYFSALLESTVYAFTTSGEKQWEATTNAGPTTPTLSDGTLYVGTTNSSPDNPEGRVYAFDMTSGDEQWSTNVGDVPLGGPTVVEKTVYTAGHNTLYAIDAASGDVDWEYEFDNGISAPVTDGERLFIDMPTLESGDHTVFAVSL